MVKINWKWDNIWRSVYEFYNIKEEKGRLRLLLTIGIVLVMGIMLKEIVLIGVFVLFGYLLWKTWNKRRRKL